MRTSVSGKAFTITEMTLILGMGALATGILTAGLHGLRMQARLALCQSHVRNQVQARSALLAEDETLLAGNVGRMVLSQDWATRLADYGCTRTTFLCPSNERLEQNVKLTRDLAKTGRFVAPQVVPTSYYFVPDPRGSNDITGPETNSPRTDIEVESTTERNTEVLGPSRREWVVDHVLSNIYRQYGKLSGRVWASFNDTTNHRHPTQTPSGGHAGYDDEHVEWRPYRIMKLQGRPFVTAPDSDRHLPGMAAMQNVWLSW